MKKKFCLIIALCMAMSVCLGFGLTLTKANAAETNTVSGLFRMKDGASVRVGEPYGIRFTTEVGADYTASLESVHSGKTFKFGTQLKITVDGVTKGMNIEAEKYNDFIGLLEEKTSKINSLKNLEAALETRLEAFIKVGCRASDIALESVYPVADGKLAEEVFLKRRSGKAVTEEETKEFKGYLTYFLMKTYAKYGVATELHVGAMRNNNSVMLKKLGLDTGFDSISEENSIKNMSRLFDKLNSEKSLPKLIIFNLNPKMNSEIMTLAGCFQSSEAKGKIQYGPAWWFLDNKAGMYKHLDDLTATGHLGAFIGMLTDSRSFLSYPRHHYFRRILCNYLGKLMENGEMTTNEKLVGEVIKDICYRNAVAYFGIDLR